MQTNYGDSKWITYSLLFGSLFGSFLFLACVKYNWMLPGVELDQIDKIRDLNLNVIVMLRIAKTRLCWMLILFIFMRLLKWRRCGFFIVFMFAFFYNVVICNLFWKYGFFGYLIGNCLFFPHYINYSFVLLKIMTACTKRRNTHNIEGGIVINTKYFVNGIVIIFFLFLGLFFEVKFQKKILDFFYPLYSVNILC